MNIHQSSQYKSNYRDLNSTQFKHHETEPNMASEDVTDTVTNLNDPTTDLDGIPYEYETDVYTKNQI